MKVINGKYNYANVMIDEIDEATQKQIQSFCNNPSFKGSYIAIMPDCHAGKGSCVGFTMPLNDRVIPDVVGVDIGCGMLSYQFDVKNVDVVALDNFIKANIPAGFNINNKPIEDNLYSSNFDDMIERLKLDRQKVYCALGTLGGGNHFIEAGYDKNGFLWVTIHSGSRNFGLQVAKYHSAIAKDLCQRWGANDEGMPFC
jgi:RNA-splicing ligase RtcB